MVEVYAADPNSLSHSAPSGGMDPSPKKKQRRSDHSPPFPQAKRVPKRWAGVSPGLCPAPKTPGVNRRAGPPVAVPSPGAPVTIASTTANDSLIHVLQIGTKKRLLSCTPRDSISFLRAFTRETAVRAGLSIKKLTIYQNDKRVPLDGLYGDFCCGRPFDAHACDDQLDHADWVRPQADPDRIMLNFRCSTVNRSCFYEVHKSAPIESLRRMTMSFPFPNGTPREVFVTYEATLIAVNLDAQGNIGSLQLPHQTTLCLVPVYDERPTPSDEEDCGEACPQSAFPVDLDGLRDDSGLNAVGISFGELRSRYMSLPEHWTQQQIIEYWHSLPLHVPSTPAPKK